MDQARWDKVSEMLHDAMQLTPEERPKILSCADPELRAEVESLLEAHDKAEAAFLTPTTPHMLFSKTVAIAEDARVGNYRIIERIGEGGMGEVFRAVRDDDQYSKEVAIKLVRSEQNSGFVVSRFRNERQILASLDHPNIARLLDGGTTEDGRPFFAMEFIAGEPIDEYCRRHQLPVSEKLKLFLQVCSAVQFAHQRLVIHRDIKPANVLVTSDGTPKLLDFGIAKLLDADAAGQPQQTLTMFRALTPGYASPEQVKGEAITTASDVYSLGVVLYELLTGHHPYRKPDSTASDIARATCEIEPEKPSTAARRKPAADDDEVSSAQAEELRQRLSNALRGDLDNIVSVAIRKEPERRYASVERLGEDIHRYLENRPVLASRGTVQYRFSKFIRRHKAGVAGGVVATIAAIAGVSATVYEAHVARQHQLRAETRFNDVRKLANSLIFDIHDSIQNLPGSTPARKIVLEEAVQYLDNLSKESSSDISLQRELASAYQRVGLLQGNALDANLGQTQAAIASLQKSLALFAAVANSNPDNVSDQLKLAHAHRVLSSVLGNSGKPEAQPEIQAALDVIDILLKRDGSNSQAQFERAGALGQLASLQDDSGDPQGAADSLKIALSINESALKSDPQNKKVQGAIAVARVRLGNELANVGSRRQALEMNRAGLDVYELLVKDQNDARVKRQMAVSLYFRGSIQLMNQDFQGALSTLRRGFAMLHALEQVDPENVLYRMDIAGGHSGLGRALTASGHPEEGLKELDRSLRMYEAQYERDSTYTDIPYWLGEVHVWRGEAFSAMRQPQAALEEYRKGATNFESLIKRSMSRNTRCDLAEAYVKIASALMLVGRNDEASSFFLRAAAIAEPLASATPPNILALYVMADAYSGTGALIDKPARNAGLHASKRPSEESCRWNQKSMDTWGKIPNPSRIGPSGFEVGDPEGVRKQLRQCAGRH